MCLLENLKQNKLDHVQLDEGKMFSLADTETQWHVFSLS